METTSRIPMSIGEVTSADWSSGSQTHNPLFRKSLSTIDYCLFAAMLTFSALIGVYFAFFAKKKQNTTSEYLMGGKNMGVTPVAMSLISSYISGITLLGMPAEIYTYGTQYCAILIGLVGASCANGLFFVPLFYELQLNSSYEYLQMRFDRNVRLLGSILYLISSFLYIPIVIYMPAIASSQVTGINLHLITPLLCIVCIFYTSLGGLKAVVWTDVLQTTMMFGAVLVVVGIGTNAIGGVGVVWERSEASGRIELFNFDPNPTIRHTFWSTAFGSIFGWCTSFSVNQSLVQRFLAMSSMIRAKILVVIFTFGTFFITAISFYVGLLVYAYYHDCDLVLSKAVRASDQIFPYFVMDVTDNLPGLPGLFMAGVFSAALSTMSTGLNSMSGVIYEDFIRPFRKVPLSEERASCLMKLICVIIGALCFGMVFAVENLGAANQLAESMAGITNGPLLAIFVLGMFFPWANAKGTLAGGVTGLIVMGYISFGTQAAMSSGQIKFEKKPASLEGCLFLSNDTYTPMKNMTATTETIPQLMSDSTADEDGPFPLFRMSYLLYHLVGLVVSVTVGLAVSAITGPTDPADVPINLLAPPIRPLFADRCKLPDETTSQKKYEIYSSGDEGKDSYNLLINRNQSDEGKLDDEKFD